LLGAVRLLATTEEHGAGRQLVRFRLWPKCSAQGTALILLLMAGVTGAVWDHAWYAAAVLLLIAALPVCRMLQECAGAMATVRHALKQAGIEDR